jgi:hypothetical protein
MTGPSSSVSLMCADLDGGDDDSVASVTLPVGSRSMDQNYIRM